MPKKKAKAEIEEMREIGDRMANVCRNVAVVRFDATAREQAKLLADRWDKAVQDG